MQLIINSLSVPTIIGEVPGGIEWDIIYEQLETSCLVINVPMFNIKQQYIPKQL